MPTSPSPRRGAKAQSPAARPAQPRSLWPRLALIGVLRVIVVVVCVLPASMITRFLPPRVQAEDFSGSVWHGSAGRITVDGRPGGALEWKVHPLALLRTHLVVDLHWVKGGFVLDGSADCTRARLAASGVTGGGPVEDLRDFGLAAGWRGTAGVRITNLTADLSGGRGPARVGDRRHHGFGRLVPAVCLRHESWRLRSALQRGARARSHSRFRRRRLKCRR